MSERIYGWLLRLYPAQFRETYGDAALQLFRDRLRDERGFFPRLRLWLDLLTDLAVSLPREHASTPRRLELQNKDVWRGRRLFVFLKARRRAPERCSPRLCFRRPSS